MAKKKPRRRGRRLLVAALGTLAAIGGGWIAIHEVPGLGPAVADGLRAALGPAAVAWAEDFAYDVQDRINRLRYEGAAPTSFWAPPPEPSSSGVEASPPLPSAAASTAPSAAPPAASVPAVRASASSAPAPRAPEPADGAAGIVGGFPPAAATPPFPAIAAPGDGGWLPLAVPGEPAERSPFYKTVIHPDARRSFAAVAVVALDLRRLSLHLVAGTQEPYSITVPKSSRPGKVPESDHAALLAAFNGGFKAVHGQYGMMIAGATFLPPRDIACTLAMYRDEALRIGPWSALKPDAGEMAAYRQTPPCLVERGELPPALNTEYAKGWGATVSGDTVIRRSGVGLDRSTKVLFYALGEAVTAPSLARALRAVGAEQAAELDVNYSFPRFLTYHHPPAPAAPEVAEALIPGIKFTRGEYTTDAAPRDFFYVTRRPR